MVALVFFLLMLLVSPFRSINRLEAEKCRAPTSADCASTLGARSSALHEQRSPVLPTIVSVVSIDRGGDDDLCVPKIRFYNIGDEGRRGQAVM
jgi:hypothetical protein